MLELLASLSLINCSLKVMLPASDSLMLCDTLVETDVKLLFTSLMPVLIAVLLAVEPTSLVEALLESDSFISVEAALLAATLAENAAAADCDLVALSLASLAEVLSYSLCAALCDVLAFKYSLRFWL